MNNIEKALQDLKQGKLIVVVDDENRENEGDLIGLPEFMDASQINFMISHAKGLLCSPISVMIAKKLNLPVIKKHNSDGTNFTNSFDAEISSTGISVPERFSAFKDLLNENVNIKTPGHLFPLIAVPGGLKDRQGHTEAAIDLAKLLNAKEVGAIIEIIDEDGTMKRRDKLITFSQKHNLTMISIEELITYIEKNNPGIWKIKSPFEELKFSEQTIIESGYGKLNIQEVQDFMTSDEATLIWKGDIKNAKNIRIHSQCQTSEIFHSYHCDCRDQLEYFMNLLSKHDDYLLIYTHDEGRGIGLFNKINAYKRQADGLDTVEANEDIGFKAEMRNFDFPSKIIQFLNIKELNLFTNNPQKIEHVANKNIIVHQIPIWVNHHKEQTDYIATKIKKMHHIK